MALKGDRKRLWMREYMRSYMRRRRAGLNEQGLNRLVKTHVGGVKTYDNSRELTVVRDEYDQSY